MKIQFVARDIEPADSTDFRDIVRLLAVHLEGAISTKAYTPQEAAEKLASSAWNRAFTRAPDGTETEVKEVDGRYVRSVANNTTEDNLISLPTVKQYVAQAVRDQRNDTT